MAKQYLYSARDAHGKLFSGTLSAESELAVVDFIRSQEWFITNIQEKPAPFTLSGMLIRLQFVGMKDMAILCRQLSTMIHVGLSLLAALNILIDQTSHPRLKMCLQAISDRIQEGKPLSEALADHPDVFPALMISMIEAGELGGVLDTVLERLAAHFEKEHKLNEKVCSAMTYPMVVMVMAILSLIFIITYVLPTFMRLYAGMKVSLPLPTQILLTVSDIILGHGFLVLVVFLLGGAGLSRAYKVPYFRAAADGVVLRIPVFGLLFRKIASARFCRMVGTLLRSGVPLISSINVAKNTTANALMIRSLTIAQEDIQQGSSFAASLAGSTILLPMAVQMIAVGEETGELDLMMEKIADYYDSDVEDMLGRLSTLIEPLMIGILGVVIGAIVISVVLPFFDIVTHFGQSM